ncbi:MAG: extracellular solute-binding protein [Coriobacteriia bacterium]|nr:extracellular solute-binding protein [Coriobacteriia bacterium]
MIDRLRGTAVWRFVAVLLAFALVFSLAACATEEEPVEEETEEVVEEPVETTDLILASTTSTQDSGLFDVLIPAFEEAYPEYKVNVIAKGTGEALELGQNKDADVLLVHAKAKEETFVADGYGTERKDVMYNDFIIVGPAADPAGLKGTATAAEALTKLSAAGASFISRGDESGTHTAEKALWTKAAITPAGAWYISAGKGMGDCLTMASEMGGYTLTDRATYYNMRDSLGLEILVEGDTALFNQYGVIPVTDATNMEGAQAFADWITSEEGQAVIAEYGVEEFGEPLFFPNAQ